MCLKDILRKYCDIIIVLRNYKLVRTIEPLNALITCWKSIFVQRSAIAVPSQVGSSEMRRQFFSAVSTAG